MIALLRGRLVHREPSSGIIDVNGVGYLVHIPTRFLSTLPEEQEILLHICTIVREDAITLYGFESPRDRELFELLRGVNKIGPKLALGILTHLPTVGLVNAINSGDTRALVAVPGIGKKTADRLCLELKSKIPAHFQVKDESPGRPVAQDPLPLALAQLDYKKSEIDIALNSEEVPSLGDASIEDRLRASLHVLRRQL